MPGLEILSEAMVDLEARGCSDMRFKIGDMVSVRSDIDNFRYVDGIFLFKSMRKQRGRVERIIGAVDEGEQGFYKINGSGFWWPGAMLNEVDMTELNTPAHYVLEDGSDSMDLIAKILGREQFKGFLRGNALKYLIRYELKGGADDLFKAMDYIERLASLEEEPMGEVREGGVINMFEKFKEAFTKTLYGGGKDAD